MVIEEKDFRLTPISPSDIRFDLELLRVKGKEEFKIAAYGITLEHAIQKIAHYRVYCKHENESIQLLKYLSDFKEEVNSLKSLCGI